MQNRKPATRTVFMRRALAVGLAVSFAGSASAQALEDEHWQLFDRYCVECHNFSDFAGGFAFELLQADDSFSDTEVWEALIRKLKAGMMPPPGNPRPESARVRALVGDLEQAIDEAALASPQPGAPALRRLNRAEYQNAVRDLLSIDVDATQLLPPDDSSAGFDTVASVLTVSASLMEAYVAAANRISRLAVGDLTTEQTTTTYGSDGRSQNEHLDGMPLGTRGGISVEHLFPLEAEYEIRVGRSGGGVSLFGLDPVGVEDPVELVINGERVRLFNGSGAVTLHMPAGPQQVQAALVPTQAVRGVNDLHSVWANSTSVTSISITGPLNPISAGDTPSRRMIFTCTANEPSEEEPCAREILSQLATRAYRQPVDEESLEILMDFFEIGRDIRDFDTGIQYALARILVDPQFIYRFEEEPATLPEGEVYRLGDYELASRLSFFLWSSIPDDELLDLAAAGELSDPDVLAAQVQRMLADPKASALVENFAAQWLWLRRLDSASPLSAEFDGSLRVAMRRETEMLFETILREDRSVIEILDADYTYVDERLARHYGIPHVRGSHFRRVELNGSRGGLLGHGSILTVTSAPNRTSPVMRGTWILENLLNVAPPPPPPGVETNLDETAAPGDAPTSIRARLEQHRADPSCAACHDVIDPVGIALENFDPVGLWRDANEGGAVDAVTELWDGTPIDGVQGLRQALVERQELFVETLVKKMMTYGLGRTVDHRDMPAIRAVARRAERDDYRFSALIQGIVETPAFQMRTKSSPMTQ